MRNLIFFVSCTAAFIFFPASLMYLGSRYPEADKSLKTATERVELPVSPTLENTQLFDDALTAAIGIGCSWGEQLPTGVTDEELTAQLQVMHWRAATNGTTISAEIRRPGTISAWRYSKGNIAQALRTRGGSVVDCTKRIIGLLQALPKEDPGYRYWLNPDAVSKLPDWYYGGARRKIGNHVFVAAPYKKNERRMPTLRATAKRRPINTETSGTRKTQEATSVGPSSADTGREEITVEDVIRTVHER